jgi:hypothetical protein
MKRYLLGGYGYSAFNYWCVWKEKKILEDLSTGAVRLTKSNISSIPNKDSQLDAYILLIVNGYASPLDNPALLLRSLRYFCSTRITMEELQNFARANHTARLLPLIQKYIICASDETFREFLMFAPLYAQTTEVKARFLMNFIPTLLDSTGAKQLSWWSYDDLDKIRIHYEKVLGKEHSLTQCLVSRWLLDLKELYRTEKAIQKIQMDQCKEEIMMNRWHPDRVTKMYEEYGIEIDDM